MNLQHKIEAEIDRLEKELEVDESYRYLKERLEAVNKDIQNNPTYKTLQMLKSLLSETSTQDYKILDRKEYTTSPRRAPKIKLADTSHYKEMLDFIEAHLETEQSPWSITDLYTTINDAGYEVGGKKPPYTLSAIISKDPRFTPTNKGWILTKKANEDAV